MKILVPKLTLGEPGKVASLQQLRERLLKILLISASVIGSGLYILFVKEALAIESYSSLVVSSIVYLWVLIITYLRPVNYWIRMGSFLLIFYVMGVINLYYDGFNADAGMFFLTFIAMAVLFIGLRGGLAAFSLSGVTIAALGFFIVTERLPIMMGLPQVDSTLRIIGGVAFLLMGIILILSLTTVVYGLNINLAKANDLAAELERMIKASQQSEERFRALIEGSTDIISVLGNGGIIQFVSPSTERLFGYRAEEVIGRNIIEFIHPDNRDKVIDALTPGIPPEMIGPMLELKIRHRDGSWRVFEVRGKEMLDNPAVNGTIVNCRDITERVQMEETLRSSNQILERMFASIRDAIFIVDAKTSKIKDCNRAASDLFGYDKGEMLGRTTAFLHVDDEAREEFSKRLYPAIEKQGFLSDFEYRMKRKDGTIFPTEHSVMPLEDSKGQRMGWVSLVRDITVRKQAEDELERRNQELSASREQLRQLAQQVVFAQEEERQRVSRELHDEAGQALITLKYSLDAIINELPENLLPISRRLSEAITRIDQTSEHIRRLSHSLRPPALDIAGIDLSLKDFCREFSEQTKIPVQYRGEDMPRLPDAVGISLYRFVQEAFANILKHAHASKVRVELHNRKKMIVLSVADNGRGMSEGQVARSSGIGLVGIKERLGLLGGRLKIHSKPERGTCITAYVPWPA